MTQRSWFDTRLVDSIADTEGHCMELDAWGTVDTAGHSTAFAVMSEVDT